jgi:hypothetical protein
MVKGMNPFDDSDGANSGVSKLVPLLRWICLLRDRTKGLTILAGQTPTARTITDLAAVRQLIGDPQTNGEPVYVGFAPINKWRDEAYSTVCVEVQRLLHYSDEVGVAVSICGAIMHC